MGSGYDFSSKNPYRLLKGRLGVYEKNFSSGVENSLNGVNNQMARLQQQGGVSQHDRMIADKRRSLDRAVLYSYQAAEILKVDATDRTPMRALINPNKLKQDYDDKIVSVGFEYDLHCGDVFEWVGTKSHWLVYLQDLTELAYFRAEVRRCKYQISWKDEEGNLNTTYAAVQGPSETRINYLQKHNISMDVPNLSIHLLLPYNEATRAYFKRYSKFYLQDDTTCWRVETLDWISMPGIIEVVAVEYYANQDEDDIKNGVVGGLIVEPDSPNTEEEEAAIIGDTFIKLQKSYEYMFKGRAAHLWKVSEGAPVKLTPDEKDPRKITLIWESSYSGQFELYYGSHKKTIIVESLF